MGIRLPTPATPRLATLLAITATAISAIAQTPSFDLLGFASGTFGSRGTGISADGNVASGYSDGSGQPGFLWTRGAGRNDFGLANANATATFGISGDGRFAVGGAPQGSPIGSAFRWSAATGYQDLSPSSIAVSEARDASFDGSVVVGGTHPASPLPFRWTETGGFNLLSTSVQGTAQATSGDGNVVVGDALFPSRAFVWTPGGGMQFLPGLDGSLGGVARAVNFDGTIIVGRSPIGGGVLPATMWVNGVAQQLQGIYSGGFTPSGVSDDGSVVCGIINAGGAGGLFAGVWTLATGVIPLSDYLAMNGVAVPDGLRLQDCNGISSDGRAFVGSARTATSMEAFVATIPSPTPCAALALSALFATRRRRNHHA